MKLFFSIFLIVCNTLVYAQVKQTAFTIPDSIKVSGILTELTIRNVHPKKESKAGIKADDVYLFIESEKNEREIALEFPGTAVVVSKGIDVEQDDDELEWNYQWQTNEPYRLAIFTATDSASNFILYSGYIYFPKDNKWKLIGTVQQKGKWGTIKEAAAIQKRYSSLTLERSNTWFQKTNGSWKNILGTAPGIPIINPMSNIDSMAQAVVEENYIQQLIKEHKTDAVQKHESIYYTIMKEGNGRQVRLIDTVTVHYKGYVLSDGTVFDQTRDRPATFPLNRLIRGWQIGVPLLKVGGKIKIIIPSGLAYGIRTRASKIPPKSILVFEVEVLDAK
jgi:hypothetical protein